VTASVPVAVYVTVPVPGPVTVGLIVTVEDTLGLSVLLAIVSQFDGSVIVLEFIVALRAAFPVA
jgi:hypothetical protein